jgi:hypothetical protein
MSAYPGRQRGKTLYAKLIRLPARADLVLITSLLFLSKASQTKLTRTDPESGGEIDFNLDGK